LAITGSLETLVKSIASQPQVLAAAAAKEGSQTRNVWIRKSFWNARWRRAAIFGARLQRAACAHQSGPEVSPLATFTAHLQCAFEV